MILLRNSPDDQGTFGIFSGEGFDCFTIELPWRENRSNISCIPEGKYQVIPAYSKRFGYVFLVLNVKGRGGILFHSGNFAGDASKGFKTHSKGCILQGKNIGYLNKQKAVLSSSYMVKSFWSFMQGKPFELEVVWKDGLPSA